MPISYNLPMIVIASFDRLFTYRQSEYPVLFEGKTQLVQPVISYWFLTISHHPGKGMVKYILHKPLDQWEKAFGINSLEPEEEIHFLLWARDLIGDAVATLE